MKSVKALVAALAASASLSACVGMDPQVAQRPAGGGAALAAFDTPVPQRMAGDLLYDPERARGGINPQAVLLRADSRYAHIAAANPAPTLARRLAATPKYVPAETGMAAPSASLPAAHTGLATARTSTPSALLTPTPLAEVEARAAIEQQAQTVRDQRFDAQVRRASSLVCSGCLSTPTRRRVQTEAQARDDAGE